MKKKEKEIRVLELPETEIFYNILIPATPERITEDTKMEEQEPEIALSSECDSSEYVPEINMLPAYLKMSASPKMVTSLE